MYQNMHNNECVKYVKNISEAWNSKYASALLHFGLTLFIGCYKNVMKHSGGRSPQPCYLILLVECYSCTSESCLGVKVLEHWLSAGLNYSKLHFLFVISPAVSIHCSVLNCTSTTAFSETSSVKNRKKKDYSHMPNLKTAGLKSSS